MFVYPDVSQDRQSEVNRAVSNHWLTAALLIAAIVLYVAGAALPATILFVAGAIAECLFWFRVFRR